MTKKFCDICGKEVTEPHPMSNARFPMYKITKMIDSGFIGLGTKEIDLCDEHQKALEEFLAPKGAVTQIGREVQLSSQAEAGRK